MAKTWLDLITPYQSGDHADGGDFTFSETEHYDGGTFEQTNRYHHIYSLYSANISTDDVVITGIRVTNDEDTYLYGEEGYVLEIEDNPFSIDKEQEVATHLGQKIIGMQFRPLNVTAQSNPLIEAGDPAYVSHKGNSYQCFITNTTFIIGQNAEISCDAESYQGRRSQGLSSNTKTIIEARRTAKKEVTSYDLRVQQLTDLITEGFGLFKSEVTDEAGGIIYYMHDKATMEESTVRWYMTTGGMIQQNKENGEWVTTSGVDNQGNALYNVLTARGINADWIIAGILQSANGDSYFDLNNNVLKTNNAIITGGSFRVDASSETYDTIRTAYGDWVSSLSPLELYLHNTKVPYDLRVQAGGIYFKNLSNNKESYWAYNALGSPPEFGLTVGNLDVENYAWFVSGQFSKNLVVSGQKNRVVKTKNYGEVLHYALESPSPLFADIGHATLGEDGLCYIDIESIFAETVDLDADYHVQLTKYGQGDLWVEENYSNYFIVKGTPNLKFAWEIKARQKGYTNERLDRFVSEEERNEIFKDVDHVAMAHEYLTNYEKEMLEYED